ncbi:hypothetical protein KIH86_17115 [Paenibacillus sp. HN-1]|uniref:hypothetical protein n=1 Tax=Paenibacillus TaxID=44249 RepID=UPI001CAA29DC|nr:MULTISPECIES: hypothetical protein [Paenibacillus]MBY9081912.1 hypothetical protein [Paenibacillus sp. CGMCC 1.18879]MBY9085930.1 hypothetical protein [Paenibacillus sinensis]
MSFRPVELQVAVPKTTEIGRDQQNLFNRTAQEQQVLADQNVKKSQEMGQRSTEVDETAESAIRDDGRRGRGERQGQQHGNAKEEAKDREAEHPYKGHNIDLKL